MLSIFPEFLNYSFLGITIIRVALGFLAVYLSFKILSKKNDLVESVNNLKLPFALLIVWNFAILFLLTGILLVIGLFTQVACIALAILLIKLSILEAGPNKKFGGSTLSYITLAFVSISLLFLGPGVFAFDLPL